MNNVSKDNNEKNTVVYGQGKHKREYKEENVEIIILFYRERI